jgi:hypothetical protein
MLEMPILHQGEAIEEVLRSLTAEKVQGPLSLNEGEIVMY